LAFRPSPRVFASPRREGGRRGAPPWEEHGTYIDRQKEEACGSLAKNWRAIEAVAEALLQRNQLTGIEVEAIVARCSPRRDPEAG
jgi:hypothetical protein